MNSQKNEVEEVEAEHLAGVKSRASRERHLYETVAIG
nr:MAG TPA: hypothetical protein [Caudoviricetes sp.]